MRRAAATWGPTLLWAGFLIFLGSRPADDLPEVDWYPGLDKAAHAALYGLLGFLARRAAGRSTALAALLSGAAVGLCWGAVDEAIQGTAAGRTPEIADLAADTLGAAAGAWLAHRTIGRRARSSE